MSSLSPGCSGDTSEEVQESDSVNELPANRYLACSYQSLVKFKAIIVYEDRFELY